MTITTARVDSALAQFTDPHLGQDLASVKALKSVKIVGDDYQLTLELGYPMAGMQAQQYNRELKAHLAASLGIAPMQIDITVKHVSHKVQGGLKPHPQIKNIIAVASGKGGVGKSTTAVNLALSLSQAGASVGILDADIYGPSQPHMLGAYDKPEAKDKRLTPIERYGLQSMSIGYLVDQTSAMIWRGPMVSGALQQLLNDTDWRNLDYLIIDLPPGTGDIQLTLAQKVPVSAAIIVTTPQELALNDARRAIAMFNKVNVPVLGVVENMSTHICEQCGHEAHLFGQGGGQQLAKEFDTSVLGQIPLATMIQADADNGKPTVEAQPSSPLAESYHRLATRVAAQLSLQPENHRAKFPKIVVES